MLHARLRTLWGFPDPPDLPISEKLKAHYRGIRVSFGYPACPDHTEKQIIWKLLQVEKNTGIKLTESCAMWPASSVSGWYFAHPESKYFGVGKIGRDQIVDYAERKKMKVEEAERWLSPYLDYDPDQAAPASVGSNCGCGHPHKV